MTPAPPPLPRVEHLARQIERDIVDRELRPQDPYLTAAEVGRRFGVHSRMAHRAMNLLADRQLLVRRRGAGTTIGPAVESDASVGVVHVVMPAQRFERGVDESSFPAAILSAIRRQLPRVGVQFDVLPGAGTAADARAALALTLGNRMAAGAVLIGCGRDIQEFLLESAIPTVVFGGTFATTASLASVDADQTLLGQLLAERLLRDGHRRIAVLMHETWLPGDNDYFEAIGEACAKARAACFVRSLPLESAALRAEAESLAQGDVATAVICRTRRRHELLCDLLREVTGRRTPGPIDTVYDDAEYHGPTATAYACIAEPISTQVEHVASLLAAAAKGEPAERIVLPVQLIESTVRRTAASRRKDRPKQRSVKRQT